MAIIDFNGMSYHVDKKLMKHWQKNSLEFLKKTNNDKFYIVDGRERIGKSTWTLQQACAIDPAMKDKEIFLSRICFTPDEFDYAARNVKNGVVIFDEAFRGLSSRGALSKTNKRLISTLMEMGQNNNIVFLVLPSFFMLDVYPAMLRSNGLFNIYFDKKNNKRSWRGYGIKDKNMLYQIGVRKGWTYPFSTKFKGRFYDTEHHEKFPGGDEFYKAYTEKKAKSLKNIHLEIDNTSSKDEKYMLQRDLIIKKMYHESIKSLRKLSEWLKEAGVSLSHTQVADILGKNTEKAEKM